MASNFRIVIHRNSDNLHLKLIGDFDENSARELLNMIKKNCNGTCRFIVHTNCIENTSPTAEDAFRRNLSDLDVYPDRILFTGDHANRLATKADLRL